MQSMHKWKRWGMTTMEMRTEKALAASHELVEATLLSAELTKAISEGTQSQLIEYCPDPCHGFPSTGYQNATKILLV